MYWIRSQKDPADMVDRMARRMRHRHRPGLSSTSQSLSSSRKSCVEDRKVDSYYSVGDLSTTIGDVSFDEGFDVTYSSSAMSEKESLEALMCDDDLMALLNDD